jgi:hypothetical protein
MLCFCPPFLIDFLLVDLFLIIYFVFIFVVTENFFVVVVVIIVLLNKVSVARCVLESPVSKPSTTDHDQEGCRV